MKIAGYRFEVKREPLSHPFRFKGGAFTEKWILATTFSTEEGLTATGIGGLAVLWSDPQVFASFSEAGGNMVMALIAEYAARLIVGREFGDLIETIPALASEVEDYARRISLRDKPNHTFLLNCLVSLDFALWKLLARQKKTKIFDDLLPDDYHGLFLKKCNRVARVPLLSYSVSEDAVSRLTADGCCCFKIKLGHPGDQQEMLEKDKDRLTQIHELVKDRMTLHTCSGKILYYLDANQRYESPTLLHRLLDHAEKIGMLNRTIVLEEPYPEEAGFSVKDLPLLVAADESIHHMDDVKRRTELGYRALALKPAGKTMSFSLQSARAAAESGLQCFVADSACVPLLVDYNKILASRLDPLPGMKYPLLESNGEEHFAGWKRLLLEHPAAGASWISARDGFYSLEDEFFRLSGGVLQQGIGFTF